VGRATSLRFRSAGQAMRAHAALIVDDTAEALLTEANRTVPLEEGTLEGSGFVAVDKANLVAVVAYDTPYAVRQHEDTRLRHKGKGRAKWLSRTFIERGRRTFNAVAKARGVL
jgi:hypothetical protein